MINLVEKNPKNMFQLSTVKDLRANIIRDHGKMILDLLKFLPDQSEWPLRLARQSVILQVKSVQKLMPSFKML